MNIENLNKKKLFWSASAITFILILFFYDVPSDYVGLKVMALIATPFLVLLAYTVLGLIWVVIFGVGKMIKDWLFR